MYFPRICNSEVRPSADGAHWHLEMQEAPWEGRHTAGHAVHRNRMWIVGGDANQGHYQNDVWSSADGVGWMEHVEKAAWHPRQYHDVAVWDGKL